VATQAAFVFVYAVTSATIPRQIAGHARASSERLYACVCRLAAPLADLALIRITTASMFRRITGSHQQQQHRDHYGDQSDKRSNAGRSTRVLHKTL